MSVWTYLFDNDYRQRADLERLDRRSEFARSRITRKGRKVDQRIDDLEMDVGELALICRALLKVLGESGIDAERLEAVMAEIDAEDGVIDGAVTPARKRPAARQKAAAEEVRARKKPAARKKAAAKKPAARKKS